MFQQVITFKNIVPYNGRSLFGIIDLDMGNFINSHRNEAVY